MSIPGVRRPLQSSGNAVQGPRVSVEALRLLLSRPGAVAAELRPSVEQALAQAGTLADVDMAFLHAHGAIGDALLALLARADWEHDNNGVVTGTELTDLWQRDARG